MILRTGMDGTEDISNGHSFGDLGKKWLEDAASYWSRCDLSSENLRGELVRDVTACVLGVLDKECEVLKHTCVTILDLKQCSSSCMVRLEDSKQSFQTASTCLPRKRFLLVAKLQALKRYDSQYTEIVLSDTRDTIKCKFQIGLSIQVRKHLNKILLLTDWNLICDERNGNQVEVASFVPVKPMTSPTKADTVLSTEAVKEILNRKSHKAACKQFDVQGTVTALSEIYRVKRDTFFCIQLDNRINILVRHPEKIHWHQLLYINNKYLFTLLKLTTLSKGAVCEQRILVPSSKSEVLCPVTAIKESITEQLVCVGFETGEEMADVEVCNDSRQEEEAGYTNKLMSYEGTVTNNSLSHFGIYILDDQIGLYVCCIPAVRSYRELRVSTRIVVSNVHMKGTKQEPKLRMICCGVSSIQIVHFSPVDVPAKAMNLPECLRQLFFRRGVNIKEFLSVVDSVHLITNKFDGLLNRHMVTEILQVLVEASSFKACTTRNSLDEILSFPHHCCLTEEKESPFMIPRIVEISDLINFSEDVIEKLLEKGRSNLNRQKENKKLSTAVYWLHHYEKVVQLDNKILIGILKSCPSTGKLMLQDKTGCVFVLIKQSRRDASIGADQHVLMQPNVFDFCSGHCVVSLKQYRIMYEQFQLCELQTPEQFGKEQHVQKHKEIVYVECSIDDITVLNNSCASDQDKERKFSELIFVEKKEALIFEGTTSGSSLRFNVKGYSLKQKGDSGDKQCLLLPESYKSLISDNQKRGQTKGSISETYTSEPRVFIFYGNAARWHSVIEENVLYKLSSSRELSVATLKHYSFQLQKVIERADKKACVKLPDDVEICRVTYQAHGSKLQCPRAECVPDKMKGDSISTITYILSSSCCNTFVSFKGEIVQRIHSDIRASDVMSQSLQDVMASHCVGTLDNRNIMLTVKSTDTEDQIQVLLSLQNIAYPLGLHPGAVILFRRLERRQKNDRVYCQYICISSIDIVSFEAEETVAHPICADRDQISIERTTIQSRSQAYQKMDSLKELQRDKRQIEKFDCIANIRMGKVYPFSCVAYIRRMIKLSVKSVCLNCHGVISSRTCDVGFCSGKDGSQFVARATAVFDDGTGSAIASFTGEDVRVLLTLTEEQWISLEEMVSQIGEIFIDENSSCVRAIEKFLSALCNSSVIKTPHIITVSLQKDRQSQDLHTDLTTCKLEDLPLRPVDVGMESVRTRFLPMLYFYCLSIHQLDNTEWTRCNLR